MDGGRLGNSAGAIFQVADEVCSASDVNVPGEPGYACTDIIELFDLLSCVSRELISGK